MGPPLPRRYRRPFVIDLLRRSPCPLSGCADFVAHFDFDDDDVDTDLNQSSVLALRVGEEEAEEEEGEREEGFDSRSDSLDRMLFLGSGLDEIVVDEECDVVEVREWKLGGVVVGGGRYDRGGGYNGVHFYVTVLHIMKFEPLPNHSFCREVGNTSFLTYSLLYGENYFGSRHNYLKLDFAPRTP
ncbi:hypothetical protein LOK49_LG12G02989 [Camellia lanceoleosa]|uniref:Uncharacterized protein n=1 Tax=Camellia lanceoleosa TaxID=1840588 RepID=A0ACC0FWF7_9ERIC|nr:hypothetical protein LOK49_LG12G02989 [Camellia lanceoleosa]